MWRLAFLITLTTSWTNAETAPSTFEMSSVVPDTRTVKFKEGGHFTLECTSSVRWMSCDWSLPGETSPCLIQHSETSKQCSGKTQSTVKTIDETTCSLEVTSMGLDDLGRYSCNLQSFPDEGTSEDHFVKESFNVMKPSGRAAPRVKPSGRAAPRASSGASPVPPVSDSKRGNSFQIDDRYPPGRSGEHPTITLKKRAPVVFNCSSTSNWMTCMWKSPMSDKDTCLLNKNQQDSKKSEPCFFGQGQTLLNYDVQYEKKGNLHTCSLKGDLSQDPSLKEEGKWNCYLQSYPFGPNDEFQRDHQIFNLELLEPARVTFKYTKKTSHDTASHNKKEVEVFDKEEIELECATEGAKPQAAINWYLNTEKIDFDHRRFKDYFKVLEKDGPSESSNGHFSYREKIKYISALEHNGHYLQCRSTQLDDEDNLEEVYNEGTKVELFIKPIPVYEEAVISAEIVGTIIGFIIILILAFLFLAFAWYTKRWCFSTPIVVIGATKDKHTGEMNIQTEENKPLMKNSETEASFGPPKPSRSMDNIYNDVEKGEVDIQTEVNMPDEKELRKPNFSLDQVIVYEFEGDNKSLVSLSSIESGEDQLDGMDWQDTFRSMGPKFTKLAELCEGSDSEEEGSDEGSDEGMDTLSKKKKAPEVSSDDQVDIGLPKKVGPGEVKTVKPVKAPVPALRNKNKNSQNGAVKLKEQLLEGSSEV